MPDVKAKIKAMYDLQKRKPQLMDEDDASNLKQVATIKEAIDELPFTLGHVAELITYHTGLEDANNPKLQDSCDGESSDNKEFGGEFSNGWLKEDSDTGQANKKFAYDYSGLKKVGEGSYNMFTQTNDASFRGNPQFLPDMLLESMPSLVLWFLCPYGLLAMNYYIPQMGPGTLVPSTSHYSLPQFGTSDLSGNLILDPPITPSSEWNFSGLNFPPPLVPNPMISAVPKTNSPCLLAPPSINIKDLKALATSQSASKNCSRTHNINSIASSNGMDLATIWKPASSPVELDAANKECIPPSPKWTLLKTKASVTPKKGQTQGSPSENSAPPQSIVNDIMELDRTHASKRVPKKSM
ncbi:hypothetical protein JVU11DRAFT_10792 [Chiua virens]|nr:hypothetical protein JVU11DRAFT_10792 [Chiua virens]